MIKKETRKDTGFENELNNLFLKSEKIYSKIKNNFDVFEVGISNLEKKVDEKIESIEMDLEEIIENTKKDEEEIEELMINEAEELTKLEK